MELNANTASPDANSYQTVADADTRLADRDNFDLDSWNGLSSSQKSVRLILATKIIDSLHYRGVKATEGQSLKFPRLFPGGPLYVQDSRGDPMPFEDWESIREYAALKNVEAPNIPEDVLQAHVEIAFQVVHSHLLQLEPFDAGESSIASLGIDVISLSFGSGKKSAFDIFSKEQFGAIAPVRLYLQKYVTNVRGALV